MTKEEMKTYAERYRKVETRLSYVLGILIFLICAVLVFVSVMLYISMDGSWLIFAVGIILDVVAIGDAFLGVRFMKYSKKKFRTVSDREAAEHYCRIHGFDPKIQEKSENKK